MKIESSTCLSAVAESDACYYRARYYDPKIGRFLGEDPIGFLGGTNFYAYVENNPTNRIDPSGLQSCCSGLECYSRCVNTLLVGPAVTAAAATAAAAANAWANFTRNPGGATEAERLMLRRAIEAARQGGGTITPATVTAAMAAASRGGAAISGGTGTASRAAGAAAAAAGAGVVLGCATACAIDPCGY